MLTPSRSVCRDVFIFGLDVRRTRVSFFCVAHISCRACVLNKWYNIYMKSILFLCHGNICRSPMAGFVMKKLIAYAGRDDIKV